MMFTYIVIVLAAAVLIVTPIYFVKKYSFRTQLENKTDYVERTLS